MAEFGDARAGRSVLRDEMAKSETDVRAQRRDSL